MIAAVSRSFMIHTSTTYRISIWPVYVNRAWGYLWRGVVHVRKYHGSSGHSSFGLGWSRSTDESHQPRDEIVRLGPQCMVGVPAVDCGWVLEWISLSGLYIILEPQSHHIFYPWLSLNPDFNCVVKTPFLCKLLCHSQEWAQVLLKVYLLCLQCASCRLEDILSTMKMGPSAHCEEEERTH